MKLSQVFLRDGRTVERIVRAVDPKEGETFVEVGPGLGVVTFPLVRAGARVVAVEIDTFLCMALRRKGIDAVCGDYLKTDVAALLRERGITDRVRFFSSVPYHITHDLLLKVFGERPLYRDIHLILQKEVAERLVAGERTKAYGPFTVLTRTLFTPRLLFNVPRTAFSPVPKVHSALIRLVPREDRLGIDVLRFLKFLKVPFGRRRKKLKNTLKGVPPDLAHRRPEEVSPETWLDLFLKAEGNRL